MKVLTCTLYKEQSMVYTEIQDLIAVNSCQIELARKDIYYYQILLLHFLE